MSCEQGRKAGLGGSLMASNQKKGSWPSQPDEAVIGFLQAPGGNGCEPDPWAHPRSGGLLGDSRDRVSGSQVRHQDRCCREWEVLM